ncbi:hypothetical protein DFH06DRAFT_140515 [Mycena polygramma]|nr:hypothetical protein DFH06DRAFT_140515 [Mycena polygramma]
MASDNNLDEGILTPNDRLINTLEKCFSELMRKQEDQSEKFNKGLDALKPTPPTTFDGASSPDDRCFSELMQKQEDHSAKWVHQAEKFQEALEALTPKLEALKPKPPVTDKKTAFWNAYKTLADEHDREFQQKYSTDLDTALIFAGLFSAVDSAFIIQIQPDIQPHGTALVILVAQNLLYVSLFSTLLAALLAVLGKQWLMYYMAAGERGTIEARGLERQRKFDGLRKWKFDAVMQMFPLLLQIGLFLFSAALSIYLWKIHLSLALIVLSFTSIGSITYTTLLISAITSPDSPFQTPLAPLVAQLHPRTLWVNSITVLQQVITGLHTLVQSAYTKAQHVCVAHHLLPFFKNNAPLEMSKQPSLETIFKKFPVPSPEVPAVSWVLETSTDPRTVAAAAEMVIDLQWPGGMDVRPQLSKLRDGILSCFHHDTTLFGKITLYSALDGTSMDAVHLGQAYCTLRCVLMSDGSTSQQWQEYWCFESPLYQPPALRANDPGLPNNSQENVCQLLIGSSNLCLGLSQDTKATKWALNVVAAQAWAKHMTWTYILGDIDLIEPIPRLATSILADYLFSVVALLSQTICGMIWRDKSSFVDKLFEHLFHALASNIQSHRISMDTAANIMNVTGQIIQHSNWWSDRAHHPGIIYRFCNSLPRWVGWINVVLATAVDSIMASTEEGEDWDDQKTNGVAGLLAALMYYQAPVDKNHIHILLQALKLPGHPSRNAAILLAHNNQFTWFQNEELQAILGTSFHGILYPYGVQISPDDLLEASSPCGTVLLDHTLLSHR